LAQVFRRPLTAGALLLVAALGTAALVMTGPKPGAIDPAVDEAELDDPARIERGRYLALAGNCASCHTAPGGEFMAGGLPFETDFGTLYSTNITPDADTGIGEWSAADFLVSMRYGLRPTGEHLYPAFPYTAFTNLRDNDVIDLFAYLKSVPPVRRDNTANALAFPYDQRALLGPWKTLYFKPEKLEADSSQSPEWNRGAYLVEALAHCSECHSPRNRLGAKIDGASMTGGSYLDRVQDGHTVPWSAPNLTGAGHALGMWSQSELEAYLKSGRNEFVETFGPMNEVIVNSTRHLSDADIEAMAVYLKSLPARSRSQAPETDPQVLGMGRTQYNLHCGTCHLPTGLGDPEMAPRLAKGSLVVRSEDPASLINVILYSPQMADFDMPSHWLNPMDEFQYLLTDDELAALASFVRASWDNRAGAVSARQVARQRPPAK
jgi:mono/diheme cytochrome c family protein